MIRLGGHVSSAGGPLKALERAQALGFTVMQIHPSAPQSYTPPTISPETARKFQKSALDYGITASFFHSIYLCNLASEDNGIWERSISSLTSYLQLAHSMGVLGTVTHLGSHKGAGMAAVLPRVINGLRRILESTPPDVSFLIENTAGAGGTIGRTLEEIEMITSGIWPHHSNVGIVLDSCHSFAAGLPIHTKDGMEAVMTEFKQRFGLEKLAAIHLNDSQGAFASNKDRHANIGDGVIGNEGLEPILHCIDLRNVPYIMEVPGIDGKSGPDIPNRLRVEELL